MLRLFLGFFLESSIKHFLKHAPDQQRKYRGGKRRGNCPVFIWHTPISDSHLLPGGLPPNCSSKYPSADILSVFLLSDRIVVSGFQPNFPGLSAFPILGLGSGHAYFMASGCPAPDDVVDDQGRRFSKILVADVGKPRRPSLDFLKAQKEMFQPRPILLTSMSVLPAIPSSLSSSPITSPSGSSLPNLDQTHHFARLDYHAPLAVKVLPNMPLPPTPAHPPLPKLDRGVLLGAASPEVAQETEEEPKAPENPTTSSSQRPGTSASFLIGRSTESGRIRFTQSLKPAEEILRKRLIELDVAPEEYIEEDNAAESLELDDSDSEQNPEDTASTSQVDRPDVPASPSIIEVERLPEIDKLEEAIDFLGGDKLGQLYDRCREQDPEKAGNLTASRVLKAFIDVVPGAMRRKSVWRELIITLAPGDELINYTTLLGTISKRKLQMDVDTGPLLTEALVREIGQLLPSRPSTTQVKKELTRRQVIAELAAIAARDPTIDLERLKLVGFKTKLAIGEMHDLISSCGLSTAFEPIFERLLASFQTQDGQFHFGAFAGCLDRLRRHIPTSGDV